MLDFALFFAALWLLTIIRLAASLAKGLRDR
jgi:hypothetical protein